jgi:hypothetical protein
MKSQSKSEKVKKMKRMTMTTVRTLLFMDLNVSVTGEVLHG